MIDPPGAPRAGAAGPRVSRRSGVADVVLDKMAHDYDDLDLAAMAHERRAEYLRRKRAVRTNRTLKLRRP